MLNLNLKMYYSSTPITQWLPGKAIRTGRIPKSSKSWLTLMTLKHYFITTNVGQLSKKNS